MVGTTPASGVGGVGGIGEGLSEEIRSKLSTGRQVDVNLKREGKSSQREQNEKRPRMG